MTPNPGYPRFGNLPRPPLLTRVIIWLRFAIGFVFFYLWLYCWAIPGQLILGSCVFIFGFLGAHRRYLRHLLVGLPALGVSLGLIGLALIPAYSVEEFYRKEVQAAYQKNDFVEIALCQERLVSIHPKDWQSRYLLALATEQLGQPERAEALMRELAPLDQTGHGPAHLRLAQYMLARTDLSLEGQREVEEHLQLASNDNASAKQAHLLLGQRLLGAGRAESAEPHLLKAAETWTELRLTLARFYSSRNRKEEARNQAASAVDAFKRLAERDPDNAPAHLHWAEALVLLDQFPQALAVLEGSTESTKQSYRQARAQVYALWVKALDNGHSNNPEQAFALIQRGLQEDQQNAALLEWMVNLTQQNGKEGEKARRTLELLLAEGKSPTILHLLLGLDLWQKGNKAGGLQHIEQAYLASPQAPLIANNLAWMLANGDPPDLPRALELIESVLVREPNQLRFRNTRGHILAKLGKWQPAVTDLEASLPALPDKSQCHTTLAEAYDHLGLPSLASDHRRLATGKASDAGH
jgi:tetratricopeptide (TPR) repeat protein